MSGVEQIPRQEAKLESIKTDVLILVARDDGKDPFLPHRPSSETSGIFRLQTPPFCQRAERAAPALKGRR